MGKSNGSFNWKNALANIGFSWRKKNRVSRVDQRYRRLRFEGLEGRQLLTTFIVNTPNDELNGATGGRSLREAIQDAATVGDIIQFDPTASGVNGGTINLLASLGEIAIPGKSLTIDAGMLSNGITIDASAADQSSNPGDGIRIFNITDSTMGSNPPHVRMIGMTLQGADADAEGGAIRSRGDISHKMSEEGLQNAPPHPSYIQFRTDRRR